MQVVLLALDAALYPTLLAAVVILVSQPRGLVLLAAYLAGGLTISIGLGLALVFALEQSGALDDSGSVLSWTADVVVGCLALLLAVALATRADARVVERRRAGRPAQPSDHEVEREPWSRRLLASGSVPVVIAASVVFNLPGAAYLIALKDIAAAHHATGIAVVVVVTFNLVMFLLAEIALVRLIVAPEGTDRLVRRVDDWVSRHGRQIAVVLSAALGVFLNVRGIIRS
jgi:hypothetical protein